jgi:hypothetical protein
MFRLVGDNILSKLGVTQQHEKDNIPLFQAFREADECVRSIKAKNKSSLLTSSNVTTIVVFDPVLFHFSLASII